MFSKLLKYDNRAVFKYWWIAALGSLIVAVIGGVCLNVAVSVNPITYSFIQTIAILGVVFAVFGLMLLSVITFVLILIRYYKNFYTDEGYLTFTLPVKKTTLLNSKLMMAMIFTIGSNILLILNIFILLAVGIPEHIFTAKAMTFISELVSGYFSTLGGYGAAYIILAILIMIALTAAQMLFIFLCITIAATITQKHKILVAIAIYYGANIALSMAMQIISFGSMYSIMELVTSLEFAALLPTITFIIVGVLGAVIAVGAGLYLIHLYMLDKKLNLE